MAKVAFYGAISLDGFLADQADSLQWLFETSQGGVETYSAFYEKIGSAVMGRISYQETKKILAGEPLNPGKQNYVFSNTLMDDLPDAIVVKQEPAAFISQLKAQEEKMIWIVGGGGLVTELVQADLIDEWWIQITPILLGKGKRLFEEADYQQRLKLVDTTIMGEFVELHYRREK
ncbi:dihydrofolate reductase family protein [Enterococcus sp. HY326]|uniref:dihydrofolate reductase family protein n=1 Tax=Enterococcus sp. HY326 TaxID=2971265 RepID=UPI00223FE2F0|nr:dihydrofolate reductase family protein [Enterococcus sp. HY326]